MSRWFRHYAGMMRDEKLVRAAIRSKQSIERVLWVWGAILESAAEIDEDGRYDFDAAEAAYFLRADEDDVLAVERELANAGRVAAGVVVKWSDRQFQSDRSADRQRRYRERRKGGDIGGQSADRDGDADDRVTSPRRHRDAPETETETETETEEVRESARTCAPPSLEPKRQTGVRAKGLPDGWQPELTDRSKHIVAGWPPGMFGQELAKFCDHAADKGRISKDWQAAFRKWIDNADEWRPKVGRSGADRQVHSADHRGRGSRDGVAHALDRELGLEPPASTSRRYDVGQSQGYGDAPVAGLTAMR